MTPEWLRQLYKVADLVVVLSLGHPDWPKEMYEPCLIGLVFPFLSLKPWQLCGTPKMYAMAWSMRRLWKGEPHMDGGDLLRKFCVQCWGLAGVSADVVSRVLYFKPEGTLPRVQESSWRRIR